MSFGAEQYSHLLISASPEFVPDPARIVAFFRVLQSKHAFHPVIRPTFEPGIIVLSPSEKRRVARNAFTGEEMTFPGVDRKVLASLEELAAATSGMAQHTVSISGEWRQASAPIQLLTADQVPFAGDLICSVQCAIRPQPVCTSDFEGRGPDGDEVFHFDQQECPVQRLGVYTNPWNLDRIEVPGSGASRFWIAFEFGKWLFPTLDRGFELLNPALVADARDSFGVDLIQAGIGV